MQVADAAASGINGRPSGHIAVTAPVLFGRMYVMPGILAYLEHYPQMEVSAIFVDRIVNLMEEGIDIAIRIGELTDSSYKAIKVGQVRKVLCAAPDYLQKNGWPASPEDLSNHQTIVTNNLGSAAQWRFRGRGEEFAVKLKPRLKVPAMIQQLLPLFQV